MPYYGRFGFSNTSSLKGFQIETLVLRNIFFAVIARKFLSKYVSAVLQEILKFGYKIKLLS